MGYSPWGRNEVEPTEQLRTKKPTASQVALNVKNPPANAGDISDMGSVPGLGNSPG